MHYYLDYTKLPNKEADEKALKDIREYLSQDQWDCLMQLVGNPATPINTINFCLGFTGVSGYPFHAFCRKYMLDKYREWMATPQGDEPGIETDEHGFQDERKKESA